ncbi:MAG: pyridoxamine 5'-phosphate oxidase family protein [Treponema sp.]|nr:pyridoxamine 5'-phosphate oxidase family protein [Treponema sp.]
MRRKDREMPKDFAEHIADICDYAVLATVNADGTPYCIPISIVRDNDTIYFHCAKDGQKIDNMKRQSEVCICCSGDVSFMKTEFSLEFESAVIKGKAEEVLQDEEKIHALRLICERYTPEYMHAFDSEIARSLNYTAIWKVLIREITGKRKKMGKDGKELKFGKMEPDANP